MFTRKAKNRLEKQRKYKNINELQRKQLRTKNSKEYKLIMTKYYLKIDFLKPAIGVYIIWFLFLRKKKKAISKESYKWMGVVAGLATVFIGAMGPLIAPLFINDRLKKESIIATKAACQAAGHLGKVPIFFLFFNVSYIEDWSVLLPLIIAVYVGTKIGKLLLGKLPEILFQNLFKSVLTLIAIRLILVQVW